MHNQDPHIRMDGSNQGIQSIRIELLILIMWVWISFKKIDKDGLYAQGTRRCPCENTSSLLALDVLSRVDPSPASPLYSMQGLVASSLTSWLVRIESRKINWLWKWRFTYFIILYIRLHVRIMMTSEISLDCAFMLNL